MNTYVIDVQINMLFSYDSVFFKHINYNITRYLCLNTRDFLGSTHTDKVLIIQAEYDEGFHKKNIISSAK